MNITPLVCRTILTFENSRHCAPAKCNVDVTKSGRWHKRDGSFMNCKMFAFNAKFQHEMNIAALPKETNTHTKRHYAWRWRIYCSLRNAEMWQKLHLKL